MIEGTIIKNGTLKIILTGNDEIDREVLKKMNGAICKLVTDNLKIGERSIAEGILIEPPAPNT